ncbi:hypothetical protein CERSUDRAFT_89014 [Gelatoporia subvermispora B]|uniref:Pyridoxal phosphate homeostasis protein n=1 Tax=Ceriporiopsis subvermispora (strain B) TaxID=914234 RepID=M2QHF7_CERS8|nr:hypothetical protein CERSUDRAFT_89014 [Gelatoporia subvermispora B]
MVATDLDFNATSERVSELRENLAEVRQRVQQASSSGRSPTLIAVSKYKPASDIQALYEAGQREFGENYAQELADKAAVLPADIKWHFIGTLQSNKAKGLASIENLACIQTLSSAKAATALSKALPANRPTPLNVLLQVNTSGEDAKSGVDPLTPDHAPQADLISLARHIINECPRLHLQGLMTIGSLTESLSSDEKPNADFERLKQTRDLLEAALTKEHLSGKWGEEGRLLLSMGMSKDFEAAIKSGSDIVRVGTSIFGFRQPKAGATALA